MSLAIRFWAAAAVFHLGLLAVSGVILRRWQRRAPQQDGAWLWALALADGALFLGAAIALAGLATLLGPLSGFTALRLISQGLFGEGILLAVAVAGVLWRHRQQRLSVAATVLALALLAVYVEAFHREPTDLQVRTHAVNLSRSPARGKLRLLHISDIQADRITGYQEHVVSRALGLAPDLIVLTGDYIQPRLAPTRSRARADLKALLDRSGFRAPLGIFAVRGDVDIDWPDVLEGTGITLLSNSSARVPLAGGAHLTLVGLTPGASRGQGWATVEALLGNVPAGDLRLLMGHNPDFVIPLAGSRRADLAVAGHTHGGQVRLPFLGAPYTKSRLPRLYASGLHDYQGIPLHVSAGVGMERGTAPQIRFLCPPEICLLEIAY